GGGGPRARLGEGAWRGWKWLRGGASGANGDVARAHQTDELTERLLAGPGRKIERFIDGGGALEARHQERLRGREAERRDRVAADVEARRGRAEPAAEDALEQAAVLLDERFDLGVARDEGNLDGGLGAAERQVEAVEAELLAGAIDELARGLHRILRVPRG